jgi:hypothetical protein
MQDEFGHAKQLSLAAACAQDQDDTNVLSENAQSM